MTLDQIDRLVRQANPVPDLSALEPIDVSVLDEQRRTEMQTHDRVIVDDEGDEPKRGRNLLIGIAAAAAIIIGALLLLRPLTDATPVADSPTTMTAAPSTVSPVEVATAFLEAYAANDVDDVDQAARYLAPDALADFIGDLETMRLDVRLSEVMGFTRLLGVCEETNSTPTQTEVRCPYDFHGIRSAEIGLGPYTGSFFDFVVQDGEIVSISDRIRFMDNGFNDEIWTPFFNWVAATYPDDVPVMYSQPHPGGEANRTPESIALWEQRSREYVEMVNGQAVDTATAFVQAFGAFDVEGLADLLAPQANMSSFEWDGEDWLATNRLLEAQGFKLLLNSCDLVAVSPPSTFVSCPFDFHSLRSDEVGLGPYTGSSFDVSLEDGMVSRASMNLKIDEFGGQMWDPFGEWLAVTYPDDVAVMYTDAGQSLERLSEDSIVLWEQRTREYVTVVGG